MSLFRFPAQKYLYYYEKQLIDMAEGWTLKVSNVRVLFKSARGVMSYDRQKPIFQHKNSKAVLEVGLGQIVEGTFIDKGKFSFADMVNVVSVIPSCYLTIDYFENVGVPQKIFRGVYGSSVFIKEVYLHKTFIKALDEDGKILLYESVKTSEPFFNLHFMRLDNAIGNWEDITDGVLANIMDSISIKNSEVNLSNNYILYALRRLYKDNIVKTANGVIYATGKHETLVIWGKDGSAYMAWLGKRAEINDTMLDIRGQVVDKLVEQGML